MAAKKREEVQPGHLAKSEIERIRALPVVPRIVFNDKFKLVGHYAEEMHTGSEYRLRADWAARIIWAETTGGPTDQLWIAIPFEKIACSVFQKSIQDVVAA